MKTAIIGIALILLFVWNRLAKSNMDVPASAERYVDEPDHEYVTVNPIEIRYNAN